ncbi:TetR/AcrR family transcriptional regulator [Lachnospiraceae bacterium ZAX-1]
MSRATFYRYFQDKYDLMNYCFQYSADKIFNIP